MSARLIAEIGADVSGFESGLNRADGMVERSGQKMARKFNKAFGAGMVAGVIASKIKDVLDSPREMAKEIESGAAGLGVTAEEYQMLQAGAEAAGLTLNDFIAIIRDQPGGLQAALESLKAYREQIRLTNEDVSTLSGSDFWKGIKTWWAPKMASGLKFLGDAATMAYGLATGTSMDESAAGIKEADAQQRLNNALPSPGLQNLLTKKATSTGGLTSPEKHLNDTLMAQSVTSRQQIGAYIGTNPDVLSAMREQTNKLDRMLITMDRIDRNIQNATS